MCGCGRTHTRACVLFLCACRNQRLAPGVLLSWLLPYPLRQDRSLSPEPTDWLDWQANELQASICWGWGGGDSSTRVTMSCLRRCWGSALRVSCLYCALSTEPPPQPSNFISEAGSCYAPWPGLELLILLLQGFPF